MGSKLKDAGIFQDKEYKVLNVIDDLKFLTSQEMEEDIRLQNKRTKQKFIKKNCMAILTNITAKAMFRQVYPAAAESERAQLMILSKEMFDEKILPGIHTIYTQFRILFLYPLFSI